MSVRAFRHWLLGNATPEAEEALVADRLLLQWQGVDHLPQRPSILLGPLAAVDAIVGQHGDALRRVRS
jgi:hypothetical protein